MTYYCILLQTDDVCYNIALWGSKYEKTKMTFHVFWRDFCKTFLFLYGRSFSNFLFFWLFWVLTHLPPVQSDQNFPGRKEILEFSYFWAHSGIPKNVRAPTVYDTAMCVFWASTAPNRGFFIWEILHRLRGAMTPLREKWRMIILQIMLSALLYSSDPAWHLATFLLSLWTRFFFCVACTSHSSLPHQISTQVPRERRRASSHLASASGSVWLSAACCTEMH